MNPQSDLVQLVKSLSRAEIVYLRKRMQEHARGKSALHIQLFNSILKDINPDQASSKNRKAHSSRTRNYLYNTIIGLLSKFYSARSIDGQLHSLSQEIDFLYERSLIQQASKRIDRARKLAYRYEKFTMLLSLFSTERKIMANLPNSPLLNTIEKQEISTNKQLQELQHLQNLTLKIYTLHRSIKSKADPGLTLTLRNLMTHELPTNDHQLQSFLAIRQYHHGASLGHLALQEYPTAYAHRKKELELFEAHPHMIEEYLKFYQTGLNNMLELCRLMNNEKTYEKVVSTLEETHHKYTINQTPFQRDYGLTSLYVNQLGWYNSKHNFKAGTHLIETLETDAIERLPYTYQEKKLYTYFNCMLCYFGSQQYALALKWANKLLNQHPDDHLDKATCSTIRLLNILIHFELKHYDMLEYLTRSYEYYLKKKKTLKSELELMRFMNSLDTINSRGQNSMRNLHEQLLKLTSIESEKAFIEGSLILIWLGTKQNSLQNT